LTGSRVQKFAEAQAGIVTVGGGRGFVVAGEHGRLVITAGHCLPHFPPCVSFSGSDERTYMELLGPLGGKQTVAAECLFVDPIGDIAVLGAPDGQELSDECEAYEELLECMTPLTMACAKEEMPAWLIDLDGARFRCMVKCQRLGPLWLFDAAKPIAGGMSGSPILDDSGRAIGVLATSSNMDGHGPNPSLERNLPGWLHASLKDYR